MQEVLDKLIHAEPLDLRRLVDCTEPCWTLISQLLQKSPDARPQGGENVAAQMKALAADARFASFEEAIASYVSESKVMAGEQALGGNNLSAEASTDRDNTAVTHRVVGPALTAVTTTEAREVPAPAKPMPTDSMTATARRGLSAANTDVFRLKRRRTRVILAIGAAWLTAGIIAIVRPWQKEKPPAVAQAPAAAEGEARLRVLVKPWGKVRIDGVERGTTPTFRVATLPVGRHVVFVSHPDFGEREITVVLPEPNREETITVDFSVAQ